MKNEKNKKEEKLRSCLLFADANIETLSLVCSFSPKMLAFLEATNCELRLVARGGENNSTLFLELFSLHESKRKML